MRRALLSLWLAGAGLYLGSTLLLTDSVNFQGNPFRSSPADSRPQPGSTLPSSSDRTPPVTATQSEQSSMVHEPVSNSQALSAKQASPEPARETSVKGLESEGLFSGLRLPARTAEDAAKKNLEQRQTSESKPRLKPASAREDRSSENRATLASTRKRVRKEMTGEELTVRGKSERHVKKGVQASEKEEVQKESPPAELLSRKRRPDEYSDLSSTTDFVAPRRGPLGLFGRRRILREEMTPPEEELPPTSYD